MIDNLFNRLSEKSNISSGYTHPVRILPNVFLGNADMTHPEIIHKYKIKVLVRLASGYPVAPNIKVLNIVIPDMPFVNIKQLFPVTNKFIDAHVAAGHNVLIHCAMGISRSATITIAYVMHVTNLPLFTIIKKIKDRISIISPNWGFMQQLVAYDSELHSRQSKVPIY